MRDTFINLLYQQALIDKKILLVTGDLGFGVLNKFITELPEQFINAGVAEQNMTGIAAGLALSGYKLFTYSIGNFCSLRCLEQIRNDVCYHKANVKIISVGSGLGYGSLGMSHHSIEDIAILRALPNLRIYTPSNLSEVEALIEELMHYDGPAYIRLGKNENVSPPATISSIYDCNPFGEVLDQTPSKILLLVHGPLLELVKNIQKKLGVKNEAYTVPCIKPLNTTQLEGLIKDRELVVTFEEHNLCGGFGSAIAELIVDNQISTRLLRIGLKDEFIPYAGTQHYLRETAGLSTDNSIKLINERIKDVISHF